LYLEPPSVNIWGCDLWPDLSRRRRRAAPRRAPGAADRRRDGNLRHGGLTAFFGTIDADPRLARIAFFEVLGISESVDNAYRAVLDRFVETLVMLAEPAFADSDLPADERTALAEGIVGAVLMIAQHWVVSGRVRPVDAVIRTTHTIVTAVLATLMPFTGRNA
jgi:hypothetical protein